MKIGRTPRELLASVTSPEIAEMMAFERLEPFGALADEYRLGQIAAVIANVNRNSESVPEPYSAADFMPALRLAMHGRDDTSVVRGKNLTPEQLSDLIDARMFGKTSETVH